MVHHEDFKMLGGAKRVIFEYIEVFYNRMRLHSSDGYMTPVDYGSVLPVAA